MLRRYLTMDTNTTPNNTQPKPTSDFSSLNPPSEKFSNSPHITSFDPLLVGIKYRSARHCGIACLIIGILQTLIWLACAPWESNYGGAVATILCFISLIYIAPICLVLLIICIHHYKRYSLGDKKLIIIPIIGLLLCLSYWIVLGPLTFDIPGKSAY